MANLQQEQELLKQVHALVLDHLVQLGYSKAANALKVPRSLTLQEEIATHSTSSGKTPQQKKGVPSQQPQALLNALSSSFDSGSRSEFFSAWEKLVPKKIREGDFVCKKLEFNLQIYFVVFVMHPCNKTRPQTEKELKKEQAEFKAFLDTKGQDLSKTSEFLAYYALPYIPNPVQHPSFQKLFQHEWVAGLKGQLKGFVQKYSAELGLSKGKTQLVTLLSQPRQANPAEEDLGERLQQMQKTLVTLQKKEQYAKTTLLEAQVKWTSFSGDIVRNCKELIYGLESHGIQQFQVPVPKQDGGQQVQMRSLQQIKSRIKKYDEFLQNNDRELSAKERVRPQQQQQQQQQQVEFQQQQPAFLNESSIKVEQEEESLLEAGNELIPYVSRSRVGQPMGEIPPLDFEKIKQFFMTSHDEVRICATIQALRWRVTRVPVPLRRQQLMTFAHFDLLDCIGNKEKKVFEYLFYNQSVKVREFTLSFLNALASEYLGRSYLLQNKDIVKTLVAALFNEGENDTYIRQNSLGTLQKFSLRKEAQNQMIQLDLINWIVETIRNETESLTDYSLEYATALLMNLSLRSEGKDKCEQIGDILNVLNELIENENMQVRTHINGTLYSILTRANLKHQAQALGMEEMLVMMMKSCDEQFQRQIQYIINQLHQEPVQEEELEDEEEEEDDEEEDEEGGIHADEQDEENEFLDTLRIEGVMTGEAWLSSQFLLTNNDQALDQTKTIMQKMSEAHKVRHNLSQIKEERPVSPFGAGENPFNVSRMGYANPEKDRVTPSAMKSRPKIPRTPQRMEEGQMIFAGDQQFYQHQQEMLPSNNQNEQAFTFIFSYGMSREEKKRNPQSRQNQQNQGSRPGEMQAFQPMDKIPRTPYRKEFQK